MEHAILLVLAGRRCKNGSQVHTSEPISPLQIDELLCRFRRTLHRNGGWCGERSRFLHVAHSPLTRTATDGSDAHNVGVFRRAVWFVIVIKTDFDNLRLDLLWGVSPSPHDTVLPNASHISHMSLCDFQMPVFTDAEPETSHKSRGGAIWEADVVALELH